MRETELRIQKYKAMLPRARERVIAALMIFMLAIAMMGVSTFSWITLSVSPEVSGVTTTIAANGNLEIALAYDVLLNEDGTAYKDPTTGKVIPIAPADSAIGDSTLSIVKRNLTWGNLVNLSDSSYGLDNITLRPAQLNESALLTNPLYSATYGVDGRVKTLISDFEYTQWDSTTGKFTASSYKGVKAISSVKYEAYDFTDNAALEKYMNLLHTSSNSADTLFLTANTNYRNLTSEIGKVSGLVSTYLNGLLKSDTTNEVCNDADVLAFYNLMVRLDNEVMTYAGEAFMRIFEVYQAHTAALQGVNYTPTEFKTLDEFCAGAEAELAKMNAARTAVNAEAVSFTSFVVTGNTQNTTLSQYISDRELLANNIEKLKPYAEQIEAGVEVGVRWGQIQSVVNSLVNISTATLKDKTLQQWFSSLSQNMTGILGILNGSASSNEVIVHDGLIERLDKLLHTGSGIYVSSITINVDGDALYQRLGMNLGDKSVKASIKTDAVSDLTARNTGSYAGTSTSTSKQDRDLADGVISAPSTARAFIAQDTYGLSIDFWVRTNGSGSYLILEGDVLTEDEAVVQTIVYPVTDENDVTTNVTQENTTIYLVDITTTTTLTDASTGESVTSEYTQEDIEVYQRTGDTSTWYYVKDHTVVNVGTTTSDDGTTVKITTPTVKTEKVVVGYSGVNRIWPEDGSLSEYSTSQGSGSCYTFYADTPEDMNQSLALISAMKIVFVDGDGNLLAKASLATDLYYAEYGKVVVPMVLDVADSIDTGATDDDGDSIYAITQLAKNEATLVTALVYLDGTQVSNDEVLSSAAIQGQLNIQFGAYTSPSALENEDLMTEVREITASVDKTSFSEESTSDDWKVNVTLDVTGSTPSSITANFIRAINSTQGSRQETFTFDNTSDGTWTKEVSFSSPGTYILRSVTVDGVEYSLKQPVTVTIPGFSFTVNGTYGQNYTYMTADNSETERFTINTRALAGNYPGSVKGVFTNENNVSITSNYTSSDGGATWTADVTFASSGTYTMQYVIIDGQYYDISATITREVYTGLRTKVYISVADTYDDKEELKYPSGGIQYKNYGSPHDFTVSAVVLDNAGNEMKALSGVNLNYGGVDAELKWNASSGRYEGEFTISSPNTYKFKYLSVNVGAGTENITVATQAPVIYSLATEPVKYIGIESEIAESVVALSDGDNTATVTLMFEHAESADVIYGKFSKTVNGETTYYILAGTNTETSPNYYTFMLPRMDGYWKLEAVKMQNVYDGTTFYTPDSEKEYTPIVASETTHYTAATIVDAFDNAGYDADGNNYYYEVPMTDEQQAELTLTKVIANAYVSFANDLSQNFGVDANGNKTGAFMQSYNVSGLNVDIKDFEGKALDTSNVQLMFVYGNDSSTYGGYTSSSLTNAVADITVDLTDDGSHMHFEKSDNVTFIYAGSYTTKLSYTVGGDTFTLEGNDLPEKAPKFTVSSVTPTVAITAISPTGTYDIDTSSGSEGQSSNGHTDNGGTSNFNETTATVYYKCTVHSYGLFSKKYYHSYISDSGKNNPYVTLTLSGITNFNSATLNFNDNTHLYTTVSYKTSGANGAWETTGGNSPYSWTNVGNCSRYVGYCWGQKGRATDSINASGKKTPAGTITADKLDVVYNGVTYTFTIPTITINNPY